MRLHIHHETVYHYSHAALYTIDLLRLTPRAEAHQQQLEWHIETPGRRSAQQDAFGNRTHTVVVDTPHRQLRVTAHGVVNVLPLEQGRLGPELASELGTVLPRQCYLRSTELTQANAAMAQLAQQALPQVELHGLFEPEAALALARSICQRVAYQQGQTDVGTTAAAALAAGRGVCQDHAHLMLAMCRSLGVPARYVSGYLHPGAAFDPAASAASHAWVDLWFDAHGWVSIDVTHACYASDQHCRVAVGPDYASASPLRGLRTGGGQEQLQVKVSVRPHEQSQQALAVEQGGRQQ